jgi:hypothetical protein
VYSSIHGSWWQRIQGCGPCVHRWIPFGLWNGGIDGGIDGGNEGCNIGIEFLNLIMVLGDLR